MDLNRPPPLPRRPFKLSKFRNSKVSKFQSFKVSNAVARPATVRARGRALARAMVLLFGNALSVAFVAAFAVACAEPPPSSQVPKCVDGPRWSSGEAAFAEKTDELGLRGVEGQRISAVDLDLDGAAD